MNRHFSIYSIKNFLLRALLLTCMIYANIASAKQPSTYYRISYYKVVPGKEDELLSMMRNVEAKVQQARIDGKAIAGWVLL